MTMSEKETESVRERKVEAMDLNDDELVEAAEETAKRLARYQQQLFDRVVTRARNFVLAPDRDHLELVLFALARYMAINGDSVDDHFVLWTWHKAICGECLVDSDGSMENACDRIVEYFEADRWIMANFPVDRMKD